MPNLFLELRDEEDGEGTTPAPLSEADALRLLDEAEITGSKLIPWGSNYSFAVAMETADGREQLAIYKPRSGESPLWDFPEGTLYLREVASYRLSAALGWDIVPPTVMRQGPHGIGSVQLYVEPMEEGGDVDPRHFWGACNDELEKLVLFDHITNNADRKLSHCLRDVHGRVWGIDHGLTFNEVPKLRTVLWQFSGSAISSSLREQLLGLVEHEGETRDLLRPYLGKNEITAFLHRVERLGSTGHYPRLDPRRNIPYGWW
jgi:uncharacterized repeat protein (TIGR03843 family)